MHAIVEVVTMKPHVLSIIVALFLLAAPVAAFGQAQSLNETPIVVANFGSPPIQAVSKPSAEFAVHRVNGSAADARGQQLLLYAAEVIPWDIMIRAIRSIVPDSDIHVIIEVASESGGEVRYGSRQQQNGPPLFFALLSAPDINRTVPDRVVLDNQVIHRPEFVPMAAPPLRHGGSVGTRGPGK